MSSNLRIFVVLIVLLALFAVTGCNDEGSPSSAVNVAPSTPSTPVPADNAVDVPLSPTLSWVCADDDDDPIQYSLHFGTTDNPPQILMDYAEQTYDVSGLANGVTYYWKIVARDDHNHSSESPVWQFTTVNPENFAPEQPSSPSPANNSINVSLDATLSWTCSDPEDDTLSYDVFFGYTPYPPEVSHHQPMTNFQPAELLRDRTYYWKIIAYDQAGNITEGSQWKFATGGQINHSPDEPFDPVPEDNSIEQPIDVNLSWSCSDPEDEPLSYDVYFGGSEYPPMVSSRQPNADYDPGVLTLDKTYYWKIVAYDTSGNQTTGDLWRFKTTELGNHPPNTPSNPSPRDGVAFQTIDVDIMWICEDPDGDLLRYDIYFSGSPELTLAAENYPNNVYDPGELFYGRAYYWKIVAHDNRGETTEGPTWRFITEEEGGTPAPPAGPSNLVATAIEPEQINLTWQDNSKIEDGFQLERKIGEGEWALLSTLDPNTIRFSDVGLTTETLHSYRVRAYNTHGESVYSNIASATTPAYPINTPTNLTAEAVSQNQINLTWEDNTTGEEGTAIERRAASGGAWSEIARVNPEITAYEDAGLTINTGYTYRARIWVGDEFSDYSNEATATTFDVPPAAPSNLVAEVIGSNIQLTWRDNSNNEDGFEIQRALDNGNENWLPLSQIGADGVSHTDNTVNSFTGYIYRLRAYNEGGYSDFSNTASAFTPYAGQITAIAAGSAGLIVVEQDEDLGSTILGTLPTADDARDISLNGAYAYLAVHSAGLVIADLTDPTNPEEIGSVNLGDQAQSIVCQDGVVYIGCRSSLWVVDVSNPASPTALGSVNLPDWGWDVFVAGNLAYVATGAEGLTIVNVSNHASPAQVGHLAIGTNALGVFVQGSTAFVAADGGGLKLVNVSDPTSPSLRSEYDIDAGAARDVTVSGGMAFVACDSEGLQIVDVSNLDRPRIEGDYSAPNQAVGVTLFAEHVYLINRGQPGLYIINIRQTANPTLVGSMEIAGANAYRSAVTIFNP